MVAGLRNVDEELARRVATGLGIDLPARAPAAHPIVVMDTSPALSIQLNAKPMLEGRKVGLLIDDGSDGAGSVKSLMRSVEKAGGTVFVVAPRIGGIRLDDDSPLPSTASSPAPLRCSSTPSPWCSPRRWPRSSRPTRPRWPG